MSFRMGFVVWIALCAAGSVAAAELLPAPEGLVARDVAERAEEALRSERTYLEAEMTVVSPRLATDRVVAFQNWDDRPGKRSFIRIEKPAKDAGSGFLKLHPNLWMYVPRVEHIAQDASYLLAMALGEQYQIILPA